MRAIPLLGTMSDAPRVAFDTTGGMRIGVGHLLRSIVLAEQLRVLGAETTLLAMPTRIPSLGRRALHTAALAPMPNGGPPPSVVVVDRPDATAGRLDRLHRRWPDAVLVAMDYYGPAVDGLTLVVNLNEACEARTHAPGPVRACGLRHVMLRDSFRALRKHRRTEREDAEQVLLGFGGTDPDGWSEQAAGVIARCLPGKGSVHVLCGTRPRTERLVARPVAWATKRHVTVADPAPLLAASDLAVIGGGTMLAEAACLGIPAIVVPRTPMERLFARQFLAAGAACVVEPRNGRFPAPALARLVRSLTSDIEERLRMRRAGRRLVDGRGAERVARLIIHLAATRT